MKSTLPLLTLICLYVSTAAQNVGIGVGTPNFPLTVFGNADNKGIAQKTNAVELGFFTSPSGDAYVQTWSAHDLDFATANGTSKIRIKNGTGFVGINNLSPTAQLDVIGTLRLQGNGAAVGRVLTATDASGNAAWQVVPGFTLPYSGTSATNSATFAQFEIVNTNAILGAGFFETNNNTNNEYALEVRSNGTFEALRTNNTGTGGSASFTIFNGANTKPAVDCYTTGTGPALLARSSASNKDIAIFRNNNGVVARIDGNGKGFFNGGTQSSGADLAEAFAVEEDFASYEPGDVLVISTTADRTVTKSTTAYSPLLAGVYATKPGVLLTENPLSDSLSGLVPMGVVGVIPTKVCSEGGPIQRGDFLVTSSTPGYAMKGDPAKIKIGTVLGKALENFATGATGQIKVLVNVK